MKHLFLFVISITSIAFNIYADTNEMTYREQMLCRMGAANALMEFCRTIEGLEKTMKEYDIVEECANKKNFDYFPKYPEELPNLNGYYNYLQKMKDLSEYAQNEIKKAESHLSLAELYLGILKNP